jgi:hypothetical protein
VYDGFEEQMTIRLVLQYCNERRAVDDDHFGRPNSS